MSAPPMSIQSSRLPTEKLEPSQNRLYNTIIRSFFYKWHVKWRIHHRGVTKNERKMHYK